MSVDETPCSRGPEDPSGSDRRAASRLIELLRVMRTLRGPDGCPWDREQDARSLRQFVLEEACEVIDAIDVDDPDKLCDELGDLLLQIVFLAQVAAERGEFEMADVVGSIQDKLVRRHPHVFGDLDVADAHEVVENWESFKTRERDGPSVLDDVPHSLPALARAEKFGRRAAQLGFDWERTQDVLDKVREELDELEEGILGAQGAATAAGEAVDGRDAVDGGDAFEDREAMEEELGDLLFSLANLARHLDQSPEIALRRANAKFERRFREAEREIAGSGGGDLAPSELDRIWEAVKSAERRPASGGEEADVGSAATPDEGGDGGTEEVEHRQGNADE